MRRNRDDSRRAGRAVVVAVVFAAAIVTILGPIALTAAYQYYASLIVVAAIFTSGVSFIVGYAGVACFGCQLFYGAGGYLTGYLMTTWHFESFVPLLMCSMVAGAAAAVPVSILLRGKSGLGFGLITLAVGQLVYLFIFQTPYLFGTNGINGIPRGDVFGISVTSSAAFLRLCLICLVAIALAMRWLRVTMFGRIIAGVRGSPQRASALGVPVVRYRAIALVVSGGVCGVAGFLYALAVGGIGPVMFSWTTGATPVLAGILGGIHSLAGPLLGGAIYEGLSDLLSTVTTAYLLWTAGIVLVIFMLRPEGLIGELPGRWRRSRRGAAEASRRGSGDVASRGDPEGTGSVAPGEATRDRAGIVLKGAASGGAGKEMKDPGLCLRQVNAFYGRQKVLDDVTLEVGPGQSLAVLGRNGVGKTTLVRSVIRGFGVRVVGHVSVDGHDTNGLRVEEIVRLGVSVVPSDRRIFPLSVRENLRLAAGGSRHWRERAEEMLEFFPFLREKLDQRGDTLSVRGAASTCHRAWPYVQSALPHS
jgi:branched-chain amino acid transport system permease protein